MKQGIFNKAVVTIYDSDNMTKETVRGMESRIADEGLYGHTFIVVEDKGDWLRIRTHYNYEGYVRAEDVILVDDKTMEDLLVRRNEEADSVKFVTRAYADILSIPAVQGELLISLTRGAVIELLDYEENNGYSRVRLYDGRTGYIKTSYFKPYVIPANGDGTWLMYKGEEPDLSVIGEIDESTFREAVVHMAKQYLGTQYRWGGKSTLGIDCSGLTSVSYMLNGVLIYRDAKLKEGFPVREIPFENKRQGDLIYFPGHIAMYIGNDEYIHSTGKAGSDGVVINSFNPASPLYREDLAGSVIATGSIF